mgnify:CR=1 FL=1
MQGGDPQTAGVSTHLLQPVVRLRHKDEPGTLVGQAVRQALAHPAARACRKGGRAKR